MLVVGSTAALQNFNDVILPTKAGNILTDWNIWMNVKILHTRLLLLVAPLWNNISTSLLNVMSQSLLGYKLIFITVISYLII